MIEVVDQPWSVQALLRYDYHKGFLLIFVMAATWMGYMALVVPTCVQVLRANPVPNLADARFENCTFDALFTLHWVLLLLTTVTQVLHVLFTLGFAAWGVMTLVLARRGHVIEYFAREYGTVQTNPLWIFNWNLNRLQYLGPCLGFLFYTFLGEKFSESACGALKSDQASPASLWSVILLPVVTKFVVTNSLFFVVNTVRAPEGATPNMLRSLRTMRFRDSALANGTQQTCSICLMVYEDNQEVVVLDCDRFHVFHRACAHSWLRLRNSCPLCREETGRPHFP